MGNSHFPHNSRAAKRSIQDVGQMHLTPKAEHPSNKKSLLNPIHPDPETLSRSTVDTTSFRAPDPGSPKSPAAFEPWACVSCPQDGDDTAEAGSVAGVPFFVLFLILDVIVVIMIHEQDDDYFSSESGHHVAISFFSTAVANTLLLVSVLQLLSYYAITSKLLLRIAVFVAHC